MGRQQEFQGGQTPNSDLFDEVKSLGLPEGRFAITASGPLGARGVRNIGDVDIVADDDLYRDLAAQHGEITDGGFSRVRVSPNVEVLGPGSIYTSTEGAPTVEEQIKGAETIHGLPFASLSHVLHFKTLMNREKDQGDIAAIHDLLKG